MGVLASTVLVDIRALLHNGNTAKAKELADAFHNAPALVWTNAFSPTMLHRQLEQLHASGPTLTSGELLKELRQAFPEQLSPKRDSSGDRTEG